MSNSPYDEGRYGGGPPASGADYGEWWRGYQDRLKGLEQPGSGGDTFGGGADLFGDAGTPDSADTYSPPPAPAGGGGGGGGGGGSGTGTGSASVALPAILAAGCLLPFLAPFLPVILPLALVAWFCLYPLSAAAALGAWLGAAPLADRFLPPPAPGEMIALRMAVPVLAALVVLVLSTCLDRRLGRHRFYRVPRHFLRVLCFGGTAGLLYVAWAHPRLLDTPQQSLVALVRPEPGMLVLLVMVAAHFVLWRRRPADGS